MPSTCAKAAYFVEKYNTAGAPVIYVLDSDETVEYVKEDIETLLQSYGTIFRNSALVKQPRVIFYTSDVNERIKALSALSAGDFDILLTTNDALNRKTVLRDNFNILKLKVDGRIRRDEIEKFLSESGYERVEFVDTQGRFAVRGEIIDLWSPESDMPARVVMSDDKIESIRYFDLETQKSVKFTSECSVLPGGEFQQEGTIEAYLSAGRIPGIFIDEDVDFELFRSNTLFSSGIPGNLEEIQEKKYSRNTSYMGNVRLFIDDLSRWKKDGVSPVICCSGAGQQNRLFEILDEHEVKDIPEIISAKFNSGYMDIPGKRVIVCYHEIFSTTGRAVRFPKFKSGRALEGLWEISAGDFVVHGKYGIGKYRGLKRVAIGNSESEYLFLEYRGGDRLYVPIVDFHLVQKYIGIEGKRPRLNSMDTIGWEKAKNRARQSAGELAKQLHDIYNLRRAVGRKNFAQDTNLEQVLSDTFVYNETPDQLRSIEEVKSDMAKPFPMDRVVLGDVGFGKTEVAVRAAFHCVLSAKQVALLAPTTILAEQHYDTFVQRLSSFPVNVSLLTRFQTKKEQKKIIENISKGLIDITIGTHRLLQKDIDFCNLGLLIIDDEHRFGVKQKEKIRSLMWAKDGKTLIDVLSLTATPIPRTLSMAFSGIKDISVIETPPEGRMEIETYIGSYDPELVRQAIRAEISRQGQVFYLHNRIENITEKIFFLQKLLPEVKFGMIHGRMSSSEIETVMHEFYSNKIDCIVATTIIESGLDIPNANTMIIENADFFGLSQLYQLRGRIGRGHAKAYCYLFHSEGMLTEDAKKRMEAINEFSRLGSGYRLALRDLEIRGAGEILGDRQHGFVQDVGLNLYSEFLHEEVSSLKGEKTKSEPVPQVEININAFIPNGYVEQDDLRITFYRRFVTAESEEELKELNNELIDRFGKLPDPVINLGGIIGLRLMMKKTGIIHIKEEKQNITVLFSKSSKLNEGNISILQGLLNKYRGRIEFDSKNDNIVVKLEKSKLSTVDTIVKLFLQELVSSL